MKNIISLDSKDGSNEIFESLNGKKFFAISIEENGKMVIHQNKISDEEIVYAANFAIHSIIDKDLIK